MSKPYRLGRGYVAAALAILLLGLLLRALALADLPMFVDESRHIVRAQYVLGGNLFVGMVMQKWLYTVVLAFFNPTGPESLWIGRMLSALLAPVSIAVCIALPRALLPESDAVGGGPGPLGLLAGLVYAVLPVAVFHERQALVDGMMAAFTAASLLLAVWQAQRPSLSRAVLLGGLLAAGYLTKLIAITYLALPVAALVLLRRRWLPWQVGRWLRANRRYLGNAVLSLAIAGVLIGLIYWLTALSGLRIREQYTPSISNTLFGTGSLAALRAAIDQNLWDIGEALLLYVGPAVLVLVCLALIWAAVGTYRWEIILLAIPALAFLLLPVLSNQVTGSGRLPPRYLLANAAPLVVLAILGLHGLLARIPIRLRTAIAGLVLAGVMGQGMWFSVALIKGIEAVPLTAVDERQYIENRYNRTLQQATAPLLAAAHAHSGGPIGLIGDEFALLAAIGPREAEVYAVSLTKPGHRQWALDLTEDGTPLFILRNQEERSLLGDPPGFTLQTIGTWGDWEVFRVEAVEPAAAAPRPAVAKRGPFDAAVARQIREDMQGYSRAHGDIPLHLVIDGVAVMQMRVAWGGQDMVVLPWDGSAAQEAGVARLLLNGEYVAFLDNGTLPDLPFGAQLETIGSYPLRRGDPDYRLRVIGEPGPSLRFAMGRERFGDPFAVESDYRALATRLNAQPGLVLAYPPHQTVVLNPLLMTPARPLDPDFTGVIDLPSVNGMVRVVYWNETGGDPGRRMEAALATDLFRLQEEWVGALRVVTYLAPPPGFTSDPQRVRFGDLISLGRAGVALIDGTLLVELQAQALAPIPESYKTATLILDPSGTPVAQYDGIPVGFTRPTTGWPVGEAIVDRYALVWPGDLPAGRYSVRLAYYSEGSLTRLPVSGSADHTVEIGEVVLR